MFDKKVKVIHAYHVNDLVFLHKAVVLKRYSRKLIKIMSPDVYQIVNSSNHKAKSGTL